MVFKRVNGRIDITSEIKNGNIVINEEEERGTRTNKFWFNDYQYMYKDVYPKTYEDYSEIIAYKLAEHLNIDCAQYDLAIYNGNLGVITRNIIKDNDNEELISGTEIINQIYTEYIIPINNTINEYYELINKYNAKNSNDFFKLEHKEQIKLRNRLLLIINKIDYKNIELTSKIASSNEINVNQIEEIYNYLNSFIDIYNEKFIEMKNGIIKSNNINDIWNIIEIYSKINNVNLEIEEFMNNLINMFIFDIITSEGDRHADNWSIIKNNNNNTIRLSPLYDNSAICSLNREKAIKNIVDYVNSLNNPTLNDNKKDKIKKRLESTINHSFSGIKIDMNDVENRNKNSILFNKLLDYSTTQFNEKLINFINQINEELLNEIFLELEIQIGVPIPNEVKIITNTVIFNNIGIINEIYQERKKTK